MPSGSGGATQGSFFPRGWRRVRQSIGVDRLRGQDGLDQLKQLERNVRIAEEQLASTSAVLKAIRVRMRRRRQGFYVEELHSAWKRRDLAATFRRSRLLRRSALGCQEEGLQSADGSAAVLEGLAGRVDQARSGRRHECYGSRHQVRVESEDA